MCVTCGCGNLDDHNHAHDHETTHQHKQHVHNHDNLEHEINLESEILATNLLFAKSNRKYFNQNKVLALNLLSSPGSGKTTLLETTIKLLSKRLPIAVIEGDQHTELDATRIRNAGANAYQINTGKTCHLDAHMVAHACENMHIQPNSILFIENVGNLICPGLFFLGEDLKVVIIATTEGDDKPLKYPDMFLNADLVIINKTDLLPYVRFSMDNCNVNIKKINAKTEIISLSATQPESLDAWINWLHNKKLLNGKISV